MLNKIAILHVIFPLSFEFKSTKLVLFSFAVSLAVSYPSSIIQLTSIRVYLATVVALQSIVSPPSLQKILICLVVCD